MANCCNDPTEPAKLDRRELIREQERYGNLLRDLFTEDPELVMLKQLPQCGSYLLELAALRAHYPSVRQQAIAMLDGNSRSTLERIAQHESDSPYGAMAQKRLAEL